MLEKTLAVAKALPKAGQSAIRSLQQEARATLHRRRHEGTARECSCCGNTSRRFLDYGRPVRIEALCPFCGALERQRSLVVYLREKTDFFRARRRVLHFAPEQCLISLFRQSEVLDYVTTDLYSPLASVRCDITDMIFRDATFDTIICSHVLEHIPDDAAAMKEIFRLLRPGGWAVIMVPLSGKEDTYEDASITKPEARLQHFGQEDHVRLYGNDIVKRLERAGFTVSKEDIFDQVGPQRRERLRLLQEDLILIARK